MTDWDGRGSAFDQTAATAHDDQARAALRDARRVLETWAETRPGSWTGAPSPALVAWVTRALVEAHGADRLLTCCHLPGSPRTLSGVWLAPGTPRVGCPACVEALARDEVRGTARDHRCDSCGMEVLPGEPWGARGALVTGWVTWSLGLCSECAARLDVGPEAQP